MEAAKTVGGWAVVIGAAAAFYWINNERRQKNRRTVVSKPLAKVTQPSKEPKVKKASRKDKDGGSDHDVKRTTKKKAEQQTKVVEEISITTETIDDEVDNREFARQLSNAKSGTITTSKAQASGRPKSVKQTRAQEKGIESSDNATAPSSTTGGDADDDESPLNSPDLPATSMVPVSSSDVSDMLEQSSAGPAVLKITQSASPVPAKKPKATKPAEVQETKKQRQNRQKAEAQRVAREQEEKERKVLEEKQRRTAREAEGRAAKDGSVFMASKAPSSSAWTAPAANGTAGIPSKVELLDTYEPAGTNGNGVKSTGGSKLADEYSGLSEEEQIRIIQEESADWKTVSKEKRKKKNPANDNFEGKEEKQTSATKGQDFGIPPVIAPTGPGQVWAQTVVHIDPETHKVVEREVEVQDSEWEVA